MNSYQDLDRLHSNLELLLAITNNFCAKHQTEPEFCGATKEARETLGKLLKLYGLYKFVSAL